MDADILTLFSLPRLEAQVIGEVISESDNIARIVTILRPEHFTEAPYRAIYERLCSMYDRGEVIDLITATNACKGLQMPENKRVSAVLAECMGGMADASAIERHAQILVENHIRRTIYVGAQGIAGKAKSSGEDIADLLNALNNLADESNGAITGGRAKHIGELVKQSIENAEERQRKAKAHQSLGITTGLKMLDEATGGWRPSQLIVLAARPAMGKTSVMLHLALSAARQGKAVCIYSLEMSDVSLTDRLLIAVADVDAERFRSGNITADDWKRITAAQTEIDTLPIYIDDNPTASMSYIRTRSKILQKRGKCDIIFADYLQLVDTSIGKNRNREQEVAAASRSAKMIAKELKVPFVLLSQLSRKVEDRADKMPQLSDIRESGAIEQDADAVIFIHRPSYYGEQIIPTKDGEIKAEGAGVLNIAKQRDGATGNVYFSHNYALTRLSDYVATPF